jgi:hypothetical protein
MATRKKVKEIKLPMRFNPGMSKYEPILPARKADKNIKFDWKGVIIVIIIALIIGGLALIINKYLPQYLP